jgi:LysM repeat protein
MRFFNLLLILSLLFTASCSSSKKENADDAGEEVTDVLDGDSDFIVDGDEEELIVEDSDMVLAEDSNQPIEEIEEVADSLEPVSTTATPMIAEEGNYTVKNGDTLMMISFNVYGDYRRWREIARYNNLSGGAPAAGSQIRFQRAGSEFSWNPQGLPYLIKRGDTLATISDDKYGTTKKWRAIYNNNKPLIRDPNLIFAGFTLYYLAKRDVASE